jgi:hypothetical protein
MQDGKTAGRKTDGRKFVDGSPGTEVRQMEVHGRKSNGRKSDGQKSRDKSQGTKVRWTEVQGRKSKDGSPRTEVPRTKIGTATSEVTTPQLARELCGNGDGNVEL